jgi:hypothetical protein
MQLTNQAEVRLAVDRALKRVYVGVPWTLIDAGGARVVAAVLDPTTRRTKPADPRLLKRVI